MLNYQFVDLRTDDDLARIIPGQSRIGVDTEFVREKTFHAQLCLVQIATERQIFCADPMGIDAKNEERAASLWQAILTPTWVLHSGRQDLEVVYQATGRLPSALFDTQVAAALVGYQPQLGYASLVKECFGVELAKSHTRANWAQRPLSDKLIHYAAEDVQYLLQAEDVLSERLDQAGRLAWAVEDSLALLDPSLYENDPAQAIERLKGARNLRGPARTAAVRLAAWREREALRSNRPRQWIMRDATLLDLAVNRPDSTGKLRMTPGLSPKTVARVGEALLRELAKARGDESDYRPPGRPGESQKAALKEMQKEVADVARELDLATELIAPKKELSAAMLGQRELRIFRGWRHELIGERLLKILDQA